MITYLNTFLRASPITVDWTKYSDISMVRPWYTAPAPLVDNAPCPTCMYYGGVPSVKYNTKTKELELVSTNNSTCHPYRVLGKVKNEAYVIDLNVAAPGRRRNFASTWWRPAGQFAPTQWHGFVGSSRTKRDIIIAQVEYIDHKVAQDEEQYRVAGMFYDMGYLPPLALCFPSALPRFDELVANKYEKRLRRAITAMKASIKHARSQFQVMNKHLTTLSRMAKSPIVYPTKETV